MSSGSSLNGSDTGLPCSTRKKGESTENYLIRLTTNFLTALNDQRYEEVLSADFLAPAYHMKLEARQYKPQPGVAGNPPVDLKTLVRYHRELAGLNPDRQVRPLDSSAIMDKHHLSGQVFMNVELTGHPPGTLFTGVLVSEW